MTFTSFSSSGVPFRGGYDEAYTYTMVSDRD